VYGPTQCERSSYFITELSRKCMVAVLPMVLGCGFNLIRSVKDKNNNNNLALMDKFNMFIHLHLLQEIRSGTRYTWSNKKLNPVNLTLDRVLVSTEWETRFTLCFAWSKTRVGSYH
jgi:hypothetical protein